MISLCTTSVTFTKKKKKKIISESRWKRDQKEKLYAITTNSSPLYKLTGDGERERWKEEREKERDTENECVFGTEVPGMRCELIRSPTSSSRTHRV